MQGLAALAHAVLEVSVMMAPAGRTMTDPVALATRVLVVPPTMDPRVRRIQGLVARVMEVQEGPVIQAQVGRVKNALRFAGDVEWPQCGVCQVQSLVPDRSIRDDLARKIILKSSIYARRSTIAMSALR
jgi:hypothetical protein